MELRGVRVLVVDDRADSRELLAEIFEISGADARAVHSADAALQAIESFEPDVVVSDLEMPDKDGYRLLADLRAQGRSMPVIAATGNPEGHRRRAADAGFAAFLAKPSPIDVIVAAVRNVLEPSTA